MLISLLVAVIVCGLVWYLVDLIPLAEPWNRIAKVVLVLILILWLLQFAGLGLVPRWR